MTVRHILPALFVLFTGAPVQARYEPLLRREAPLLAAGTRLHLVRPCEVYPVERRPGSTRSHSARSAPHSREAPPLRGPGLQGTGPLRTQKRLLPGDRVRVRPGLKNPSPLTLTAAASDGVIYRVKVACLSRTPPDYSYRGKGTFQQFYRGLVRDLPRIAQRHLTLLQRHDCHIPVTDRTTHMTTDDWDRANAIHEHINWVRSEMFHMAYSGRSERTVLQREADWITGRSEEFIRGFSGDAPLEVKAEMKKIYLLLNRLTSISGLCGGIRRLRQEMDQQQQQTDQRYTDLEPAHRARLQSEDVAKLHSRLAELRTRINTVVVEVRTGLLALGIKVR